MRFKVEGTIYEFDETRLLVREARELMHHTGMGLRAFGAGLQEGNPDSIVGMLYLSKRRSGEAVKWSDFDELNLAQIDLNVDDEPKADAIDAPVPPGGVVNGQVVRPDPPAAPVAEPEVMTPV